MTEQKNDSTPGEPSPNPKEDALTKATEKLAFWTKWMAGATIVLGVCTVFLVAFGWMQASDSDKQIGFTQSALTDQRSANANQLNRMDLTLAHTQRIDSSRDSMSRLQDSLFRVQARAALFQVDVSRETEIRQLRAYIYIDGEDNMAADEAGISVKNDGLTPAYNIRGIFSSRATNPADTAPPASNAGDSIKTDAPLNNGIHTSWGRRLQSWEIAQEDSVKNGLLTLWLWGVITYNDAFGIERHTHFRVMSEPHGSYITFKVCQYGNKAD